MKRALETALWGVIAIGLHAGAVSLFLSDEGAAESAGSGGEAQLSLVAASASVAAMVDEWERPPEVQTAPAMTAPTAPAMPQMPAMTAPVMDSPMAPAMPSAPALPMASPQPPQIDTAPAERQPDQMPEIAEGAFTRPPVRPADLSPPAPKQEPVQAQTASGSGGSTNAGQAQARAEAQAAEARRQSLVMQWGAQVAAAVERRKRYPSAARGAAGRVTVRITVAANGGLQSIAVVSSSGNEALDQAAIRAAQTARYPPAPSGLPDPSYSFNLPISFQ
ncbi:energy transducer TonB [Marivivens donghaensis]|uniref:Energy transducer TonB n=1 Tax=Marivivens donghaensis TaxID=1699413 RepID=A0ABX0VZL4_9RHOB|nr:energy transducer TonB [Marivivens donghaensis]NIY73520.1 energy transducer TonB [Marivivens donghaensis]